LVVGLKGLVAKMNWFAVNRKLQSNSDSDSDWLIQSRMWGSWSPGLNARLSPAGNDEVKLWGFNVRFAKFYVCSNAVILGVCNLVRLL
jgi:hypothetical protein